MEIPLFFDQNRVDNFKMMAKVIGKSVSIIFYSEQFLNYLIKCVLIVGSIPEADQN
jgi:hypothetical protein